MHTAHILIIEDNRSDVDYILYGFKKYLLKNALEVIYDGNAAVDYCRSFSDQQIVPDLILLDMNLPRVHGIDVLKVFKEHSLLCKVPIVITTASLTRSAAEKAVSLGATGIIEKPIKIEKLINLLKEHTSLELSLVVRD